MTRGSKASGDALLPIEDDRVKDRAVDRVGDKLGVVPTKLILPRRPAMRLLVLETDAEEPISVPLTIVREGSPWPLRRGRDVEGEVELKGLGIIASRARSREREDEEAPGIGIGIFCDLV